MIQKSHNSDQDDDQHNTINGFDHCHNLDYNHDDDNSPNNIRDIDSDTAALYKHGRNVIDNYDEDNNTHVDCFDVAGIVQDDNLVENDFGQDYTTSTKDQSVDDTVMDSTDLASSENNFKSRIESGRTINLTESIYFTKTNRKLTKHTHFSILIKTKLFEIHACTFLFFKNC